MFFWNSLAFSMIQQMFAIWSLVLLPFLNSTCTSGKFSVHVLLKPSLMILSKILLACVRACVLSHFSHVQLFVTLWTAIYQGPLSMAFSRHEYWSGLPYLPLGELSNPGIKPESLTSPAFAGRFFTLAPPCRSDSMWNEHNCMVILTFFGIALPGTGMKIYLFQSCGHCWAFQICGHIERSTLTASYFRIWKSSVEIPSPPLALFTSFLRPTWLHTSGGLALGEWPHHCGYLGH